VRVQLVVRGVDGLRQALAQKPAKVTGAVYDEMRRLAQELRGQLRARAPVFTGALRRRISVRVSRSSLDMVVTLRARSRAPHSFLVEHGRRPGKMPPWGPQGGRSGERIARMAERIGARPFAVARAIGARGTQPRPFWDPARQALKQAEERVLAAVRRSLHD
jgi:hypothetical protein